MRLYRSSIHEIFHPVRCLKVENKRDAAGRMELWLSNAPSLPGRETAGWPSLSSKGTVVLHCSLYML
jgi:hypothetical protein